ncbi:MAG: type II toxin-antitoxin system HicB family antitoxin [Hyphomicrobiales bacterium]|nr:type II toxin-antitoxin system HicB family antitoxin [Hyphomicrobiales bacterium]
MSGGSSFDPAAYEVVLMPLGTGEGGGWLATVPALPGSTGDGATEMAAIDEVRLAAHEWADAAAANGDPIPAPVRNNPLAAE